MVGALEKPTTLEEEMMVRLAEHDSLLNEEMLKNLTVVTVGGPGYIPTPVAQVVCAVFMLVSVISTYIIAC